MNTIILHTYGDSHASPKGAWDRVIVPNLSIKMNFTFSKLMYSWSRDKTRIDLTKVKENDWVCFCFGEIDMRNHIHNYEPDWKQNIDELTEMYFQNIKANLVGLKVRVFIYNIIPHLNLLNPPKGVPRKGTAEDIKKYTLYANSVLREKCENNDYTFLDSYNYYLTKDGFLSEEKSDMICHLKDPQGIIDFLLKEL